MGKAGIQRVSRGRPCAAGLWDALRHHGARALRGDVRRLERRLFTIIHTYIHTLFTITVGAKPASHAQYVADSSSDILSLLEMLREEHR